MTRRLNNPFVEYGYKGSEYFCDREQETVELVRDLHNESNVALISRAVWASRVLSTMSLT